MVKIDTFWIELKFQKIFKRIFHIEDFIKNKLISVLIWFWFF